MAHTGVEKMRPSYCQAVRSGNLHPVHTAYHDTAYGFPLREDAQLFGRLLLEINQAGLSWELILKRQGSFCSAYAGFDPVRVAAFGEEEVARLLADPGVIRNRRKILAAIENARRVVVLTGAHGSFAAWLDRHHPRPLAGWIKVFREAFVFTGGEIVNEFLLSTGYLPGAHDSDCPVMRAILREHPPWTRASEPGSNG